MPYKLLKLNHKKRITHHKGQTQKNDEFFLKIGEVYLLGKYASDIMRIFKPKTIDAGRDGISEWIAFRFADTSSVFIKMLNDFPSSGKYEPIKKGDL